MAKAKTVHSTERRTASKTKSKRSEIVEQCVIYVQQVAAYDAGFGVDHTGDSEYAGKGRHLKKANRALFKLVALSPHLTSGAQPLTTIELYAKAGVLAALYGLKKDMEPNKDELMYIRFFAGGVSDFFATDAAGCAEDA